MVAPTYFKFYQTIVGNGLARSVYKFVGSADTFPPSLFPFPYILYTLTKKPQF